MAIDTIHIAHHQALRTARLRSRQFCGHGPDLSTWRPVGEGERGQERGRDTENGGQQPPTRARPEARQGHDGAETGAREGSNRTHPGQRPSGDGGRGAQLGRHGLRPAGRREGRDLKPSPPQRCHSDFEGSSLALTSMTEAAYSRGRALDREDERRIRPPVCALTSRRRGRLRGDDVPRRLPDLRLHKNPTNR